MAIKSKKKGDGLGRGRGGERSARTHTIKNSRLLMDSVGEKTRGEEREKAKDERSATLA